MNNLQLVVIPVIFRQAAVQDAVNIVNRIDRDRCFVPWLIASYVLANSLRSFPPDAAKALLDAFLRPLASSCE